MAGIGFELRRLTRQDDLHGIVEAYAHSVLAATGPWLLTIVALGGIVLLGSSVMSVEELNTFRIIIIYNFAFSLVMAGPIVMIATRFLADAIYARHVESAPGLMLGGLVFLFATEVVVVVPFYFFYTDLEPGTRLAAAANFFLIAGIWLVSAFLTALKDYHLITGTFGIGMIVAVIASALVPASFGVAGMLLGFSAGLVLILFVLIARVLAEYPYAVTRPFDFRGYFRRYWELALSGFVYNLGIWIDKWVMWTAPEAVTLPSRMVSHPDYDSAMFLAYLTIVPSMAAFVLAVETDFFEAYARFYRDIQQHAPYSQIEANHRTVIASILRGGRNLLVLQASVCVGAILMAPQIFALLNINFAQIGIFRLGVLGALFHIMFLATLIVISYFDLRMVALRIQGVFLVSNGVLTYVTMQWGFPYYGYGYLLSTMIAFVVSFIAMARFIRDLPYQTFVVHNTSVQ